MSQIKPIKFITPFTTVDYPEHLACIVWFSGCNMRCQYCYNVDIVLEHGEISTNELMTFLKKRVGLLDGVVLSGGECTLYGGLNELCEQIKDLGYKIKLDTNGSNPKTLKNLCENDLIDFAALDFKAPLEKFKFITNAHERLYGSFLESLEILVSLDFPFETRTTVHEGLLDEGDISAMSEILHEKKYKNNFYLQYFLEVPNLGDLKNPNRHLDISKIQSQIPLKLRNF